MHDPGPGMGSVLQSGGRRASSQQNLCHQQGFDSCAQPDIPRQWGSPARERAHLSSVIGLVLQEMDHHAPKGISPQVLPRVLIQVICWSRVSSGNAERYCFISCYTAFHRSQTAVSVGSLQTQATRAEIFRASVPAIATPPPKGEPGCRARKESCCPVGAGTARASSQASNCRSRAQ
jgi:hypothetical protein